MLLLSLSNTVATLSPDHIHTYSYTLTLAPSISFNWSVCLFGLPQHSTTDDHRWRHCIVFLREHSLGLKVQDRRARHTFCWMIWAPNNPLVVSVFSVSLGWPLLPILSTNPAGFKPVYVQYIAGIWWIWEDDNIANSLITSLAKSVFQYWFRNCITLSTRSYITLL